MHKTRLHSRQAMLALATLLLFATLPAALADTTQ